MSGAFSGVKTKIANVIPQAIMYSAMLTVLISV